MKQSKYRAKPTIVDGIRFASKKEAARFVELLLLLKAGKITDLRLQPRIPCKVNGELICTYVGDFSYFNHDELEQVIEDVKGVLTPIYKLKRKLVRALHDITIKET